jgi:hypothetical protein
VAAWNQVVMSALEGYLEELVTPEWRAEVADFMIGLVETDEILDDDWEAGVRFMGAALADEEVAEDFTGLLKAALLGELIERAELGNKLV